MFKLKPGNVIQKLNTMDRKKAYTIGAVVIVCFVALLTIASLMGDANETSFDGLNSRGYDLAQMPFVNDEAEKYLLASKYPDMKENNSMLLYSSEEKKERQEQDAKEAKSQEQEESAEASSDYGGNAPTSRVYRRRSGGENSTPTHVNTLGTASIQGAQGSGINGTFGSPRGDFSPYKSQDKGTEIVVKPQKMDERKALYQYARNNMAAASLKEGKAGNIKRAMLEGDIKGSEAFTDKGVDLSKAEGLQLDTNAPVESGDLGNVEDKVNDTVRHASETAASNTQRNYDQELLNQLWKGLINIGVEGLSKLAGGGIDALTDKWGWTHNGSKFDLTGTTPSVRTTPSVNLRNSLTGQNNTTGSRGSFGGFGGSNQSFGGFGQTQSGFDLGNNFGSFGGNGNGSNGDISLN